MIKYKVITTKSIYWTTEGVQDIITYNSKTEYGKKPFFPYFTDIEGKKIAVNPQYVIAIEKHEDIIQPPENLHTEKSK